MTDNLQFVADAVVSKNIFLAPDWRTALPAQALALPTPAPLPAVKNN